MKPVLTVEFSAKAGGNDFKEESVPIHSPDELFAFAAPAAVGVELAFRHLMADQVGSGRAFRLDGVQQEDAVVAGQDFQEETVAFNTPEEMFAFVAPGGDCERIPDEVDEIQIVFLPPAHPNTKNPTADIHATLEVGMVFFTGPLSEISQTIEQLIDKAGRGELSDSFLNVIGVKV